VVGIAAELRHVHPGAECGSGTRQPDRRHSSILRQPLECLGQKQAKLDREGVSLLGPVERHQRAGSGTHHQQRVGIHR
jgi:hypothetical protein